MAVHLRLEGLEKRFADDPVLAGVDLDVRPGETLALLGPSGSGKTTALRIAAGFETPDRGRVLVDDEDVTSLGPARRRFGMVFQHYALFPHLTVGENVAFGLEAGGTARAERADRVAAMLRLVGLEGLGRRRIGELSGGQQQRVALARALAPAPRVLLLDEPLSNLDPALRERTRVQLRDAVGEVGITTVLVTHEQEEAFHLGDRVAVLHRGRLEQVGPPADLYRRPASRFVAGFVGRASELAGRVVATTGARVGVRIEAGGGAVWDLGAPGAPGSPRPGSAGSAPEAGAPVTVAARPEALELVAADAEDALRGRVVDRRFTGPLSWVRLEIGEAGATVEVAVGPADDPRPGEVLGVRPRADSAVGPWVFPAAAAGPGASGDEGAA